jgi:hypothetical protein
MTKGKESVNNEGLPEGDVSRTTIHLREILARRERVWVDFSEGNVYYGLECVILIRGIFRESVLL